MEAPTGNPLFRPRTPRECTAAIIAAACCVPWPPCRYSDGIFHPYLALDCTAVAEPKARQESEYIEICSGVGHDELMDIVVSGRMNTVGLSCVLLALRTLERNGVPLR